jgi:hypothetical protein
MSARSKGIGRIAVVLGVGLFLAVGGAVHARAASPRVALDPAPVSGTRPAASPGPFVPSLLARETLHPTSLRSIARSSWWGGPVVTSTGETVTIYVSDRFNPDESIRLSWANFFAWLYHGSELSRVTIYQAPSPRSTRSAGQTQPAVTARRERFWCSRAMSDSVRFGYRRARVRPPHCRQPPERPLGCDRLGTQALGERRRACTRVAAGTAFPGDGATTTPSTPARRSRRLTAS